MKLIMNSISIQIKEIHCNEIQIKEIYLWLGLALYLALVPI
jgi:hypothetical protein